MVAIKKSEDTNEDVQHGLPPRDYYYVVKTLYNLGLVNSRFASFRPIGEELTPEGQVFLLEHPGGKGATSDEERWQTSKQQADKALEKSRLANTLSWIALGVSVLSFLFAALQ